MDHWFPPSKSFKKEDLTRSEWIAVIILTITLLALVVVDKPPATPQLEYSKEPLQLQREVMIEVKGAVAKPGVYHFPKGVTLKQILERVEPLPNAVVDGRSLRKKYKSAARVFVESSQS